MTTARQRKQLRARPGRKLLGLDLGQRRIGIAVSDDLGAIAFPMGIVDLRRDSIEAIARLAEEHRVEGIVAGLPTTLGGEEGFQAREAKAMAGELARLVTVPIVFWDERLTSTIADRVIEGSGGRRRKSRSSGERDSIAASIMLQSYLDANPLQS